MHQNRRILNSILKSQLKWFLSCQMAVLNIFDFLFIGPMARFKFSSFYLVHSGITFYQQSSSKVLGTTNPPPPGPKVQEGGVGGA